MEFLKGPLVKNVQGARDSFNDSVSSFQIEDVVLTIDHYNEIIKWIMEHSITTMPIIAWMVDYEKNFFAKVEINPESNCSFSILKEDGSFIPINTFESLDFSLVILPFLIVFHSLSTLRNLSKFTNDNR